MEGVVLFVDDKIYDVNSSEHKLYKALQHDYPVLGVNTLELAEQAIKSIGIFKAIILDWDFKATREPLEDDDKELPISKPDDLSAYKFLVNKEYYSLIYLYSVDDLEDKFSEATNDLKSKYGDRIRFNQKFIGAEGIINEKDKIKKDIYDWHKENKNLSLPFSWSSSVIGNLQRIFTELSSCRQSWVKDIYQSVKDEGDPIADIIYMFQCILYEHLISDKELRKSINSVAAIENEAIDETSAEYLERLYRKFLYSDIVSDAPIMTGDIFDLGEDNYGVLISPECDLRHIQKVQDSLCYEFLLFCQNAYKEKIKDLKLKDKYLYKAFNQSHPRIHIIPSFAFKDACYPILLDFRCKKQVKPDDINISKRKCRLNSPYIQSVRQRYLSYQGRVGVPNIPDSLRKYNLRELLS